ncbi:MAG: alpha-ketoglutarate-dependent dioxygenase AlkB [Paracoccaceae bacterium]
MCCVVVSAGTDMVTRLDLRGVTIYPGFLDRLAQESLRDAVLGVLSDAPLFTPVTPRGQEMSVRMSAAGQFGWITDRRGYRYEPQHPAGVAWPAIPAAVMAIWSELADCARLPECCLINWYSAKARMGLHQDKDEVDFSCPVLSVSLGDDALFRIGNATRGGRTESIWLRSGDVAVMGGEARLLYHGIDRLRPGSSSLFSDTYLHGGRVNLTLRVVTPAPGTS